MKLSTSDIQFHNAHLEARADGSYQIARYPRDVLNSMNDGARRTGIDSCGAEIRFHTTAPTTRITLSCEHAEGEVQIYRGPFLCETQKLEKGVPTVIELTPNERLNEATHRILESGGYSTNLWRLLLGRGSYRYHFIETFGHTIRPPLPEELPSVNWLAYGSSITHSHLAGHPYHASRLLHWNLHAKGLSGSCHLEPAATDYFAIQVKESNLDIITAELGVNMRDFYSVEEFTKRAEYFIKTLRAAAPGKPIVLITAFTNSVHYTRDTGRASVENQMGFDNSLRKLHAAANDPDLHLIEGCELLPDFTLLNSDVLHPSPSGQALMGHLLTERLRQILPDHTESL